jgi:hypothetical protein
MGQPDQRGRIRSHIRGDREIATPRAERTPRYRFQALA